MRFMILNENEKNHVQSEKLIPIPLNDGRYILNTNIFDDLNHQNVHEYLQEFVQYELHEIEHLLRIEE